MGCGVWGGYFISPVAAPRRLHVFIAMKAASTCEEGGGRAGQLPPCHGGAARHRRRTHDQKLDDDGAAISSMNTFSVGASASFPAMPAMAISTYVAPQS